MAFSMNFVFCIYFELAASIEFDFLTILFANSLFNMDSSNPSSNTLDLRVFGFIFSETGYFDIFPVTITDVCARVIMNSYVLSQDFSFGLKYFFHFYNCEYHGASALQLYSRDTFYLRISRFSFFMMIRFEKIFAFQLKDYYNFWIIFTIIFPIIVFYCCFYSNLQNDHFLKLLNFFFFQDNHA